MAPIGFRRFSYWTLQLLGSTFALRIHSVSCQDLVQRNSRVLMGPYRPPNYELVSKPIHYCPLLDFYIYICIMMYPPFSAIRWPVLQPTTTNILGEPAPVCFNRLTKRLGVPPTFFGLPLVNNHPID
jgi:hypothetical protein